MRASRRTNCEDFAAVFTWHSHTLCTEYPDCLSSRDLRLSLAIFFTNLFFQNKALCFGVVQDLQFKWRCQKQP